MNKEEAMGRVREELETLRVIHPERAFTPDAVKVAIAEYSGRVITATGLLAFHPKDGPLDKQRKRDSYRRSLIEMAATALWALELGP